LSFRALLARPGGAQALGQPPESAALQGARATAANRWQHFEPNGDFNLDPITQGFYPLLIHTVSNTSQNAEYQSPHQ
jgi:hypothetical protein